MIPDYKPLLDVVDTYLSSMGFTMMKDTDFSAHFEDAKGWKIVFEGERYVRPLIDITIEYTHEDRFQSNKIKNVMPARYSLRILMEVFEDTEKTHHVIPSLTNQLEFLNTYRDKIFVYPPPYAEKYNKKNNWT